jgi:hypothetical protein
MDRALHQILVATSILGMLPRGRRFKPLQAAAYSAYFSSHAFAYDRARGNTIDSLASVTRIGREAARGEPCDGDTTMDPEATLRDLLNADHDRDLSAMEQSAHALAEWLGNGGHAPVVSHAKLRTIMSIIAELSHRLDAVNSEWI